MSDNLTFIAIIIEIELYTIEIDKEVKNIVGMYVKDLGISNCKFKILKQY